ncbi:serine/threonine-protein kinase H1 homolog [Dendronephthya gigantea]|uniref:serine/threonine-protein kinase H1 homolog n=1 Tax=Dendronephthya gigantea TaxID=151771 RepID=UPI00106C5500|nr:serine/threonine-protein kinase H1 homolog [Dendronephthya gigantea]
MGGCIGRKKVEPSSTNTGQKPSLRTQRSCEKSVKRREIKVNAYVEKKYNIIASIGKGEFGHVLRVEHRQTKIPYAIKIIDISQDLKEKANSQSELRILSKVQHKYVIRLYDVIQTPHRLYLVMDLATGGELMDRICLLGKFDECDATSVLSMILEGLRYLHSIGITHRDLKPQNILYYHPGNDSKIIITDFGLSAMRDRTSNPASYLMKTDCGTIEYMAPEVITRALYTNAVDMWSMGVIAYIVLSGRLPFPLNGNILSTLRMICFCKYSFDGEPWNDISDDAKDFITSLLVFDASKRLTAHDALEHKWIKTKEHGKLNLQRSISSNWNDSSVSLKNEKGLKRRARTTRDNSGRNGKGKTTYGSIHRSRDDELHKGSGGKKRVSTGHKNAHKYVSGNSCAEKAKDVSGTSSDSGEIDKNLAHEITEKNPTCLDTEVNGTNELLAGKNSAVVRRKASKQTKVTPVVVASGKKDKLEHSIDTSSLHENTACSGVEDCNSNLAFVRSTQPPAQRGESREDGETSSKWDIVVQEKKSDVTEKTPLKRAMTVNKRATLLPPIQSSVAPFTHTVQVEN